MPCGRVLLGSSKAWWLGGWKSDPDVRRLHLHCLCFVDRRESSGRMEWLGVWN